MNEPSAIFCNYLFYSEGLTDCYGGTL